MIVWSFARIQSNREGQHENPAPLNSKGSATRKGKTGSSAMTYWSGIL
jgi:hypothetical protein